MIRALAAAMVLAAPGESVLGLPDAWRYAQGTGVVVAVIDSGVRADHPDLRQNLWVNTAERPGNGRDDDANGYVDDVHGVDLSGTGDLRDRLGHGTHVAGTVAAAGRGVAFRAKVMTVKVLGRRGTGSTRALAEGIRYAVANGARIINLSLETTTDDPRVRAAVKAAERAGVLIVCSAGNGGQDVDRRPLYPVAIPSPNLIGVAAASRSFGLTRFSNRGAFSVPVAAPGEGVVSTALDGGYEARSGTSMAAPHVAGVAALMASANPGLSAPQLRALLLEHAVRGRPGDPGYLDALGSVLAATRTPPDPLGQPPALRIVSATRSGTVLRAQFVLGGARAVRVRIDGRVLGMTSKSLVVLRRRGGRTLTIEALAPDGRVVARASAPIGGSSPAAPALRLSGSSAALDELVARVRGWDGPRLELVGGGTGMGIGDAARGIVDAGLASRAIFPSDPAGLVFTPFARHDGCLVTNGEPSGGIATAAAAEFVADLGTPAPFPSSQAAAAYVRSTPGSWGFVDPADTDGLAVTGCRTYPLGLVTRGPPRGALARLAATLISADGRASD